jgi:ribokinase
MIAVLGSINMDLVVRVPRFPMPGETLNGRSIAFHSGGKGANQAVAAARLGADVYLFGKVGGDVFGERLLTGLRENGVNVDAVEREEDCATGLASIWVNDDGENVIVLSTGANVRVDGAYLDRHLEQIGRADFLLMQLEIPVGTVATALSKLPSEAPTVILDPAPAQGLSELPLERIDILTPNEQELAAIGRTTDIDRSARRLLDRGVGHVICTLGARGASWFSGDGTRMHIPAPNVDVVDTTAAGDAFNGALAWALQTCSTKDAIERAVVSGALTTTAAGAQPSLPDLSMLERGPNT